MNWKAKGLAGALIASTALLAAPSVHAAEAIEDFTGGEAYAGFDSDPNGTTIGLPSILPMPSTSPRSAGMRSMK